MAGVERFAVGARVIYEGQVAEVCSALRRIVPPKIVAPAGQVEYPSGAEGARLACDVRLVETGAMVQGVFLEQLQLCT